MLDSDFEKFRETVLADERLQAELRGITDKYAFVQRVIDLGSHHGYTFSREAVEEAIFAGRRILIEHGI